MLNCPACENSLHPFKASDLEVDVCNEGCGGIWFDNFELKKVDEAHETLGEALLDIPRKPGLVVDMERKRTCPKCKNYPMMRHFESVRRRVSVDECPACGGHWLDYGELGEIRGTYKSEAEGRVAAQAYFADLFDGKLKTMAAQGEAERTKAQRIAWMFRFICPTYYIPGKQDGGAF